MAPDPTQTESSLGRLDSSRGQARDRMASSADLALPQSRRMRLSELDYEDIPRLSSLFAQTQTHPLLMDSPTRFIDVAAIVACVHRLYAASRGGLGAWRADTLDGAFIGLLSLIPIAKTNDVEIHVRLKPDAWGRWYAIEGTHLLCQQAFDRVGLPRLFGYCHPDHHRVQRIMSHFGFRHLGLCEHRGQMAHRYELDAVTWRERSPAAAH